MELIGNHETSVLNQLTPRNIPEDGKFISTAAEDLGRSENLLICQLTNKINLSYTQRFISYLTEN
jgi:hypothetical protein